jgi:hypothetical protein
MSPFAYWELRDEMGFLVLVALPHGRGSVERLLKGRELRLKKEKWAWLRLSLIFRDWGGRWLFFGDELSPFFVSVGLAYGGAGATGPDVTGGQ